MKEIIKNNKIYLILGVSFILCLFRAFKGFCWTDESFYLSTADRFYRGDALLVSEWYRTQLSSVICLPFYALYMWIAGSNVGVILYFRILYLILSLVTAIIAHKTMKKDYPDTVTAAMAVLIMFYAHLNVTALSYYMMSIDFLLIALFVIYDYSHSNSNKKLIAAGVAFALSVLSLPSFAVFYFAALALVVFVVIVNKFVKLPEVLKKGIDDAKIMPTVWYTMIGIAIPAAIFVIYLFSKVSIAGIIEAVPNIMVDKEHDFTVGFCIRRFFFSVSDVYGKWTYVSYALMGFCFLFSRFIKKTKIADIILILDAALFVILAIRSYGHTGYIQTALCLFALPVFFLANKKNYRLFWLFVPSGFSLAMTYSFSSSDFLYVLAIGHFAVAIACIGFLYDYVVGRRQIIEAEGSTDKMTVLCARFACVIATLIVLYVCGVTIALRMSSVYRDAPIPKMTEKINYGVAKGLYTTPEHLGYYDDVYEMIEDKCMKDSEGNSHCENILFSKILPWGYMVSDLSCGYPTTWRATAYNAEQLTAFYNTNQGKQPDIIVVLNEEYGSYDASGDVEDDHNPNLDEMNDYWKDYIKANNMTKRQVKCGVIYRK